VPGANVGGSVLGNVVGMSVVDMGLGSALDGSILQTMSVNRRSSTAISPRWLPPTTPLILTGKIKNRYIVYST
jgi:hypothetical protein